MFRAHLKGGTGTKYQSVMLLISVGKDQFEGPKLEAIVDVAIEHINGSCQVIVADTLQRYNMEAEKDISSEEAFRMAFDAGSQWINNNQAILDKIPRCEIIRWEDLRVKGGFTAASETIHTAIKEDTLFAQALDDSVEEYTQRKLRELKLQNSPSIRDLFKSQCRAYLTEECIRFLVLDSGTIFYPGRITSVLEATLKGYLPSDTHIQWQEVKVLKFNTSTEADASRKSQSERRDKKESNRKFFSKSSVAGNRKKRDMLPEPVDSFSFEDLEEMKGEIPEEMSRRGPAQGSAKGHYQIGMFPAMSLSKEKEQSGYMKGEALYEKTLPAHHR